MAIRKKPYMAVASFSLTTNVVVMNKHTQAYPIKIVSRTASLARLRKIRLSWFVAGVAFSLGCTSALTPIFNSSETIEATDDVSSTVELSDNNVVELENIVSASNQDEIKGQAEEEEEVATNDTPPTNTEEKTSEVAAEATVIYPQKLELKAQKGDTLASILARAGVSKDDSNTALSSIRTVFNPRKLDTKTILSLNIDKDAKGNVIIKSLKIPASAITNIELSRNNDDQFIVKKLDVPVVKKLARVGSEINGNIYKTGANLGIPSSMMSELVNAYSYDVDFQRDLKKGSSLDVLFERTETKDGAIVGSGNLVFSELTMGDKIVKIYRYTDKNGHADFYNEKGESIRKALLRTPVNGARITSGYGMREHPLSGYTKMHKGVDFGAPTGTPVYAAGDGVVEVAARENGYGNFLKIKHTDKYATAYAHLSRYAGGISPGKRVKQGQIVAYVGSTGASTGPHLHYEILVKDEQVNPANVRFKMGNVLQGKDLLAFRSNIGKVEERLASIGRGKTVAMTDDGKKSATN